MTSQSVGSDPLDSEHLVGKVLAAEPPLVVIALVSMIGVVLAANAITKIRHRPKRTSANSWKRLRHA